MRAGFFSTLWATLIWCCISTVSHAGQFKPPTHHAEAEHIARGIAYLGGNTKGGVGMRADPELRDAAAARGLVLREVIDDTKTGMQAMVLKNKASGETYIAFRGTWPTSADGTKDVVTDLDASGDTGSSQYNAHKATLRRWAKKYPGATITGHSLGAALAQRFVSEHPHAVKEAVLFNAPAIAKQHGHRLARAKKQPPVTIYVGRSTPTNGTLAPAFDIVSEYGGQSHVPAHIVEVTHLAPIDGSGKTLMNSHTGFMLSGPGRRRIEDVPYEQFQQRREDNWRKAQPVLQQVRSAVEKADAAQALVRAIPGVGGAAKWAISKVQVNDLFRATARIAHGFGRRSAGPTAPTSAMSQSAERDCTIAEAKAAAALARARGQVTGTKLSAMKLYLRQAQERAVGCPVALAQIASARNILDTLSRRLLESARGNIKSCDARVAQGMANSISSFLDRPEFVVVHQQLKRQAEALNSANAKIQAAIRRYRAAEKAGNLNQMDTQALAVMEVARADRVKECMDDTFMIGRNMRTAIVSHRAAASAADAAIDGCDLAALRRTSRELKGDDDAISKHTWARVRAAFKRCKKSETPQQRLARWTKRCVAKKGPGATVGFISKNGKKFWCRRSKAVADARCARKKKGAGWVAGPISKKGAYKCVRTQQKAPRINLAGRWIVTSWAHPGEKWRSPTGVWLDVTAAPSGTSGTLTSVSKIGKGNVFRGKWRHLGNGLMEVLWSDGERLRYKITKLTATNASIVTIADGLRVNYRR